LTDLETQGLTVFEFRDAAQPNPKNWLTRDLEFGRSKVTSGELAELSWFLHSTLSAGQSLEASIEIAAEVHSSIRIRKLLNHVQRSLRSGVSPGDAFRTVSSFPHDFVIFVRGGGASNELTDSFLEASTYFQQKNEIKSRVINAIAYPFFLLLAGICVFAMILFYLTPTLHQTIVASGQTVQGVLGYLEKSRSWIVNSVPFASALLLALLVGVTFLTWSAFRLILKYFPALERNINARDYARLSRVISALLRSGVPLSEALSVCLPLASKSQAPLIRSAISNISVGERTHSIFDETNNVPFGFSRLYTFGERANELSSSLNLAAEILERQYRSFTTKLVSVIAPSITLIVGGGIGFLVYVVISAVLQVSSLAAP